MTSRVHTCKNTTFQEWKDMVFAEFSRRKVLPLELHPKRHLHGYESGDTPYAWVDFLLRQQEMQKRSMQMRRDNPQNY